MYLRRWPFRQPWGCDGAIPCASSDGGGPGLSYKPLNAAIGQLLAQYRPDGHQGARKQNDNAICAHFAAGTIPRASLDGVGPWLS